MHFKQEVLRLWSRDCLHIKYCLQVIFPGLCTKGHPVIKVRTETRVRMTKLRDRLRCRWSHSAATHLQNSSWCGNESRSVAGSGTKTDQKKKTKKTKNTKPQNSYPFPMWCGQLSEVVCLQSGYSSWELIKCQNRITKHSSLHIIKMKIKCKLLA